MEKITSEMKFTHSKIYLGRENKILPEDLKEIPLIALYFSAL
jgi:hypothetical protein